MKKIMFVFGLFFLFLLLASCDKEAGSTTTITSVDSSTTASMTTTQNTLDNKNYVFKYKNRKYYWAGLGYGETTLSESYFVFEDDNKLYLYRNPSNDTPTKDEWKYDFISEHYINIKTKLYYIDSDILYSVYEKSVYIYNASL